MGFGNEKFAGFGKALTKTSAKKKLKKDEDKDEDKEPKKKKKKSWWEYGLGSGGRSKTTAQENQGK